MIRHYLLLAVAVLSPSLLQAQTPAALLYDPSFGAVQFAANDVKAALNANGFTVAELPPGDASALTQTVRVIIATQGVSLPGMPSVTGLSKEGYAIRRVTAGAATNFWVIGFDVSGAMYGGLELAEAINLSNGLDGVTDRQTIPHIKNRGIKFNIPLDVRTPSYTDDGDSAQANIGEVWEQAFWIEYLDNLARSRYNLLSLWSLNPFPSMIKTPDHESVALADVKKKQGAIFNANLLAIGMFDPTWTLTTVKTMTIEQKMAHWQWVMQYAKDRGIDIYIFTWNIYTYGTNLSDIHTDATTKSYFRKSVRAMFNQYPLLAGMGVTAGENMHNIGNAAEEQWLWDTYGQGISDARADSLNPASPFHNPNRIIRLVHRAHFADLNQIISFFGTMPGASDPDSTLSFSFKYSDAHMLSSVKPAMIYDNNWFAKIPAGKKVFLTVRNDSIYNTRWGDPDFARDYLTNFPDLSKIAGFYMGPDGYTWGREAISTEPDSPRQHITSKMWYSFLLFGRLSFDPTLPNSRFESLIGEKFPGVSSSNLFQGWASASKVIPLINRFYWGNLDYFWYPEACSAAFDSPNGFRNVQNFIDAQFPPMQSNEDGAGPLIMSIKEYVDGAPVNGRLTPLQVADQLQLHADNSLTSIQPINPGTNKELRLTVGDIKIMSHLGRYYASKIRGAVSLYRYQKNGSASDHAEARTQLIAAAEHWRLYAAIWSSQYIPQRLGRLGRTIDVLALQTNVNNDIPAALISTVPESLPWTEDFSLPAGTKSDGAPSSWTSSRGGVFEVNAAGQFQINGAGGEGAFNTADIDISGGEVKISLTVQAAGGLDLGTDPDYVRIYKIIDGGAPELITPEILGGFTGTQTILATQNTGSKLKLRILSKVNADSEFYYLDNIKVEYTQPLATYTLSTTANNGTITVSPTSASYGAGSIITLAVKANLGYTFTGWSGDLSGTTNPTTVTMNQNKNISANFSALLPTSQTVLLVVSNATSPTATDAAISNRLRAYGFTVQLITDTASTTNDATGKSLIIISSSVASGNVSTKFQAVAVPVINWETALQDELLLTTTANQGTSAAQSTINVVLADHPLVANVATGLTTIVTAPKAFSWGIPGGSPIIVARLNDTGNQACIYAYEAGAAMNTGTAPARRIHLFLQNDTFLSLNPVGLKLFDAAVAWAMNLELYGGSPTSLDYTYWTLSNGLNLGYEGDDDNDGKSNFEEYVFGMLPKSGSSVTPIQLPLTMPAGTFSYTRRINSATALTYSIWYSTDLKSGNWVQDTGAVQGAPVINGEVETVLVTISADVRSNPTVFIRVRVN